MGADELTKDEVANDQNRLASLMSEQGHTVLYTVDSQQVQQVQQATICQASLDFMHIPYMPGHASFLRLD